MISRKTLIVLAIGLVLVAGGASKVIESFGAVSGTADVERPLEIKEIHYEEYGDSRSGEYVLLEANKELDLSNWNLSAYEDGVNFNNISESGFKGEFALVTNTSSVSSPDNVQVFEAGTIDEYGLADGGEEIVLEFMPQDSVVHRLNYSGSECSVGKAYQASGGCQDAVLTGDTQ